MEYFLAYIKKDDDSSCYVLVKANNMAEAYDKVRKQVSSYYDVEISSAIE